RTEHLEGEAEHSRDGGAEVFRDDEHGHLQRAVVQQRRPTRHKREHFVRLGTAAHSGEINLAARFRNGPAVTPRQEGCAEHLPEHYARYQAGTGGATTVPRPALYRRRPTALRDPAQRK